jgi:hypothetical protein
MLEICARVERSNGFFTLDSRVHADDMSYRKNEKSERIQNLGVFSEVGMQNTDIQIK